MRNHMWGNIHTHTGSVFPGASRIGKSRGNEQAASNIMHKLGQITSEVTKASIPRLRVEIFLAADNLG